MFSILQTEEFESWLDGLADQKARAAVARHIVRMEGGLLGDVKSLGDQVSEARLHYGPGYRPVFHEEGADGHRPPLGRRKAFTTPRHEASEGAGSRTLVVNDVHGGTGNMALKLKPFDAAKYLDAPEAQAELLDDALKSGDSGYIAAALGAVARAKGMTELAKKTGLNRAALYEALSAGGNPTLDTIMRVARALDIELGARRASEHPPGRASRRKPRPPMIARLKERRTRD